MAGAALCVWGCERGNASLTECPACKRLFHHCCAAQHGQEDSNLCGAWTSGPGCRVGATGEPCAPHQLLSPSSAAVERVFSIMRRTFHEQQDAALADMIRTSLMLQYNNRSDERLEDRRSVL
jgi:hypothetical protein